MHDNREKLRMGISIDPPVSQEKINDLVQKIVPEEVEKQFANLGTRPLPSNYTILQLLKSFSSYNIWMAQAAKDGIITIDKPSSLLLLKRGIRHAYDMNYSEMVEDISAAYKLKEDGSIGSNYFKLMEWMGMCFHLKNQLKEAEECY